MGRSPQITAVRRMIGKAAANRLPVMLLGESGTGKEVVARAIHETNPQGRFVPIDCGSLVSTLMESDLFGHAKGAFTSAGESKRGLLELADGGTAFFDEIGDLPLEMQVKLLRLLQEGEFRAVGSLQWQRVDLRIIAATHRNLKAEVAAGRFRMDLFYRLNVFGLTLPPLRHRKEDIPLLAEHFLRQASAGGAPAIEPSSELLATFQGYDWPGNVRELKHCIDRLVALRSEGALEIMDLPSALLTHRASLGLGNLSGAICAPLAGQALPEFSLARQSPVISLPASEREAITRALAATNGKRAEAARMLEIGRTTLFRKMKQYGIE
ncbi:MAG: sigma-54 dependent transcriptional regulator [Candidatus Solibacter sp.]